MKHLLMTLLLAQFAGCLNSNDTIATGKNEIPVVPRPDTAQPAQFIPGSFQSTGLKGPMSPAAESLSDVENKAIRGCGGGLDCIPAYSYPNILSATDAGDMGEDDLVLGVNVNGKTRAYPLSTLWQHEVANDTLGGTGISVNYCPLTGTGLNFRGALKDGTPVTFGVSGLLHNNNLILYDRQTLSFWPQMLFTSAWGEKKGEQISLLPIMETTWKAWKHLFPNTTVVSRNFNGSYPYGDYYTNHDYVLFPQTIDKRLQPKDLVIGVIGGQSVKVYPFKNMKPTDVINDNIDGVPILILFSRKARSAQVFERLTENGKVIEFTRANPEDNFLPEVASPNVVGKWNFAGKELSNESPIVNLKPVVTAFKGFWLSWGTYYKVSDIYGEK